MNPGRFFLENLWLALELAAAWRTWRRRANPDRPFIEHKGKGKPRQRRAGEAIRADGAITAELCVRDRTGGTGHRACSDPAHGREVYPLQYLAPPEWAVQPLKFPFHVACFNETGARTGYRDGRGVFPKL